MTIGDRNLRFECEFPCIDCQSILRLQTYRAIVEGVGQIVVCRQCNRPYRVFRKLDPFTRDIIEEGAQMLPRDAQLAEVRGMPPLATSFNVAQPPHKIRTHPMLPGVCYVCSISTAEHPPEPELFVPGGKPEGM